MQRSQRKKFCGLKKKRAGKCQNKLQPGPSMQSPETNSSSGIISDGSNLSWPADQSTGCNYTKESLEILSSDSLYPNFGSKSPIDNIVSPRSLKKNNSIPSNIAHRNSTLSSVFRYDDFLQSDTTSDSVSNRFHLSSSSLSSDPVTTLYDYSSIHQSILIHIFKHLSPCDICRCARVCKKWYTVAWSTPMWYKIDMSKVGSSYKANVNLGIDTILNILSYKSYPYCYGIKEIDFSHCQITDNDLIKVANTCPELKKVCLSSNSVIQNQSLCHLVSVCIRINYLNASKCIRVTQIKLNPILAPYSRTCIDNIKVLDVSYCKHLNDSNLQIIASSCSSLKSLNLRHCILITDDGIKDLVKFCKNIKQLDLSSCCFITDVSVCRITSSLQHLQYLALSKCHQISDKGIQSLAEGKAGVIELRIRSCPLISDCGLQSLRNCKAVDLFDNSQYSLNALQIFLQNNRYTLKRIILKDYDYLTHGFVQHMFDTCVLLNTVFTGKQKFVKKLKISKGTLNKGCII